MDQKKDAFDTTETDIFDAIELPFEEKIVYSEDMQTVIREAIQNEIAKLPIGKMVAGIIKKESEAHEETSRKHIDSNVEKVKGSLDREIQKLKTEFDKLEAKMRKKHDEFRSLFGRSGKPWYQFGGFPAPSEGLVLVGARGISEWRLVIDGDNLSVQKLENGTWNEKAAFLPTA